MANWTHAICEMCWMTQNPDREPVRIKGDAFEPGEEVWCCFCRDQIDHGPGVIFVRHDPKEMSCADLHNKE